MVCPPLLLISQTPWFFPGTSRSLGDVMRQVDHVLPDLLFCRDPGGTISHLGYIQHYSQLLYLPTQLKNGNTLIYIEQLIRLK